MLYTGKTLFPSVLAKELNCHFINLKLTDVVRGNIGAGEQAIFSAFQEARQQAPSVVFIDEFQVRFRSALCVCLVSNHIVPCVC